MLPTFAERRIYAAEAVAENLRAAASECSDRPVVAARHIQAAETIDEVISIARSAAFAARTNHDTLVSIAQAYRERTA